MKRFCWFGTCAIALLLLQTACATYFQHQRQNVLRPQNEPQFTLMDFSRPIRMNPMEAGWYQYKFNREQRLQQEITFIQQDGRAMAQIESEASIARLFREVDIDIGKYPLIAWSWKIQTTFDGNQQPETTQGGDDHPARIILIMESATGDQRELELVWGNRLPIAELFMIDTAAHYVVRSGVQVGQWFDEQIDIWQIYQRVWPDDGLARITDIGIAGDSDQSQQKTLAFIANLRMIRQPIRSNRSISRYRSP
ncbi:DUF3047 domain-containing protein [Pseudobacteriovorax antillogorgiicola]|uniref:DUF3047 domain-containing protein n=1 Tax=Pseudobacteriovorax antillogorgiicola TaxID=1513793 RepID=A0A1Y6BBX3_9BACT|nr:DUF3047 domain-containing protein [Pseudobacteriovorax antillogorgiicola]TCS58690.1 DUF3047 family protein [Pseudobacteriovorax antillogorgiicola]SME95795.1 Protein of unknown function [Pseudobacteriovorax antillogorgiicola]